MDQTIQNSLKNKIKIIIESNITTTVITILIPKISWVIKIEILKIFECSNIGIRNRRLLF